MIANITSELRLERITDLRSQYKPSVPTVTWVMHRLLCSRIGGYTKLQLSSCLGTEAFLFEERRTQCIKKYQQT